MKLKVEIVYDSIKNETTVLVWEGMVVVSNKTYPDKIESTQVNMNTFAQEYEVELTK